MTMLFLAAEVIAHVLDRRKPGAPLLPATICSSAAASKKTRLCGNSPRAVTTSSSTPRVSRQIRLVVNPSAGKGRALALLPRVAGTLRDGGADLQILLSRDFLEAQSMTRRAIQDGADVLAVMGGDGMMHLGSTPWRRRTSPVAAGQRWA